MTETDLNNKIAGLTAYNKELEEQLEEMENTIYELNQSLESTKKLLTRRVTEGLTIKFRYKRLYKELFGHYPKQVKY